MLFYAKVSNNGDNEKEYYENSNTLSELSKDIL